MYAWHVCEQGVRVCMCTCVGMCHCPWRVAHLYLDLFGCYQFKKWTSPLAEIKIKMQGPQ